MDEPRAKRPLKTLRVILYFAFSPSEELTARDIEDKFGIPRKGVHLHLRPSIQSGILSKEVARRGKTLYRAGEELREMVRGKVFQPLES